MNAVHEPPHREAVRERLVSEIPGWYSPLLHLATPTLIGLGLMVCAAFTIHALNPLELLFVPLIFVFSNAVEWRAHKYLLHRRTRFMEVLYDRHTPEHHVIYVFEDMAIRSRQEFKLVLIPAFGILAVFVLTTPILAGLWLAGQQNLAALFVMSSMFYVLSYEWLHLSYHMPPESFIGRRRVIRFLRHHHATHHRPELMQKWNFNVNVPLWDWVKGTTYKG